MPDMMESNGGWLGPTTNLKVPPDLGNSWNILGVVFHQPNPPVPQSPSNPAGSALVPAVCWSPQTCGVVVWMCSRRSGRMEWLPWIRIWISMEFTAPSHVQECGCIYQLHTSQWLYVHPVFTPVTHQSLVLSNFWLLSRSYICHLDPPRRCPWWFAMTCPTTASCTSTASAAVVDSDERVWRSTSWRSSVKGGNWGKKRAVAIHKWGEHWDKPSRKLMN